MSDLGQARGVRTELFLAANSDAAWLIQLLDSLARYPFQQHSYLGEFDTISVGKPLHATAAASVAVMLGPPLPGDPESLGAIAGLDTGVALVHRVVGITEHECEFAIERGGEALWRELMKACVPLEVDQVRNGVIGARSLDDSRDLPES